MTSYLHIYDIYIYIYVHTYLYAYADNICISIRLTVLHR